MSTAEEIRDTFARRLSRGAGLCLERRHLSQLLLGLAPRQRRKRGDQPPVTTGGS